VKLVKIGSNYYNPEAIDAIRPKGASSEVLLRGGAVIDVPLNPDQFEKAVREGALEAIAVLVNTQY
jgi:hypothetical protein